MFLLIELLTDSQGMVAPVFIQLSRSRLHVTILTIKGVVFLADCWSFSLPTYLMPTSRRRVTKHAFSPETRMAARPTLPPSGIEPSDQYSHELRACRTSDKKSIIIYPRLYRPKNDPQNEDPAESCMAWQNQEDGMDQLNWLKKIHEVIDKSEPTSHPRVQMSCPLSITTVKL